MREREGRGKVRGGQFTRESTVQRIVEWVGWIVLGTQVSGHAMGMGTLTGVAWDMGALAGVAWSFVTLVCYPGYLVLVHDHLHLPTDITESIPFKYQIRVEKG